MVRILVCGGRDYADLNTIRSEMEALGEAYYVDDVTIVHGAATGVDTLAGDMAAHLGFAVDEFPADWNRHGRAAGPIRNQQMLDSGVDLVVAFPGGRGTADMKRRARDAGVEVFEVSS